MGRVAELYGMLLILLVLLPHALNRREIVFVAAIPAFFTAADQAVRGELSTYPVGGAAAYLMLVLVAAIVAMVSFAKLPILTLLYRGVVTLLDVHSSGASYSPDLGRNTKPAFEGQYRQIQGGGFTPVQVKYLGIGIYQDAAGNRYKGSAIGPLKKC